jgi:hypothetical protein
MRVFLNFFSIFTLNKHVSNLNILDNLYSVKLEIVLSYSLENNASVSLATNCDYSFAALDYIISN